MADTRATVERLARKVSPGEKLFEEGEPGGSMYVLQSGRVRLVRRLGQAEVAIALFGPGEVFGEMAVLEDLPRTATAVASEESVVVEVTKPLFEQMVRENGEVALRILRKLSARLREADRQINTFLTAGSVSRTVELLRQLAVGDGKGRRLLPGEFNSSSLATLAGVSLQAAQDMDRGFRKAGVLDGESGQATLASDGDLDDYLDYLELRKQYDPLPVSELAGVIGLPEEEVHRIVQKLLAARLAAGEGSAQPLVDRYQHYLSLKRRFEYSQSIAGRA
jgi:CRP/FNR family cyclic AMP-dependent transcriptional regulator